MVVLPMRAVREAWSVAADLLLLLGIFPLFARLPILFAVPVSAILLSLDWGGWTVAISLGGAFGLGFGALFDIPNTVFVIGGGIGGGLYWLTLRLIRLKAFRR